MENMSILGLNLNISWKDKYKNFETIKNDLKDAKADLILLPEMFSTGFCMDAEEIADQENESLNFLKELSQNKNAAVCGSTSVKDGNQFYNRMYFVEPDCNIQYYDKRHLFSFSGEDKIYSKGNERVIVEYLGFRILLQICYDLRFPVFSRNNEDYDVALYVASWPEKRVDAWKHLLKARAIENQCYVFGLNRIGIDGNNLHYTESSHCYFADGSEISIKKGNIIKAIIERKKLNDFRNEFRFLEDRDNFDIKF